MGQVRSPDFYNASLLIGLIKLCDAYTDYKIRDVTKIWLYCINNDVYKNYLGAFGTTRFIKTLSG